MNDISVEHKILPIRLNLYKYRTRISSPVSVSGRLLMKHIMRIMCLLTLLGELKAYGN